jgi:hypothetical protein
MGLKMQGTPMHRFVFCISCQVGWRQRSCGLMFGHKLSLHDVETPEERNFVEDFSSFWCKFAYSTGSLQAMAMIPMLFKLAL